MSPARRHESYDRGGFFHDMIIGMNDALSGRTNGRMRLKAAVVATIIFGGGVGPCAAYAASADFARSLSIGSADRAIVKDVSALQAVLIAEGFMQPPATGYFGKKTKAALQAWQSVHGIVPATGLFGPRSRSVANAGMPVISPPAPSLPAAPREAAAVPIEPPKALLVVAPTPGFSSKGIVNADSLRHTLASYAILNGGTEAVSIAGFRVVGGPTHAIQATYLFDMQATAGDEPFKTASSVGDKVDMRFEVRSGSISLNPGETKQISVSAVIDRQTPEGRTISLSVDAMKAVGVQSGQPAQVSGTFSPSELAVLSVGRQLAVTVSSGGVIEARGKENTVMKFRVKNYADKAVSMTGLAMRWVSKEDGLLRDVRVVSNGMVVGRHAGDIRLPSAGIAVEMTLDELGQAPIVPAYGFRDFAIEAYVENFAPKARSMEMFLERLIYGYPYATSNASGLPIVQYLP